MNNRRGVDLDRQTGYTQHLLALLVVDVDIVDNQSVDEAQVHTSHLHFRPQLVGKQPGSKRAKTLLHIGNVQKYDDSQVECYDCPDDDADDAL